MLVASPPRFAARVLAVLSCAIAVGCSDDSPTSLRPTAAPSRDVLATPIVMVMNTDDAGPGSLRQAIFDAPQGATIQFDASIAGKTIVLSSGHLKVFQRVTIEGPVPAGMTVSGGLQSAVISVFDQGDLTLRNLSIVDGRDAEGGGIEVRKGSLVLDHSLVANNETPTNGGGIRGYTGTTVTLLNSTVSGNVAALVGGGVLTQGTLAMRNSTIADNSAPSGGGIAMSDGTLSVRNSLIANNVNPLGSTDANCAIDASVNVSFTGLNISDGNCAADPAILNANPLLGSLADNGGPTKTHALLFGSPAIDAGLLCSETTDQRYIARTEGVTCDVGAFEFNAYAVVTLTIGPNVAKSAKTGVTTVTGTISCSRPTSTTLTIALSQTQKVTGRFATIVQGNATTPLLNCGGAPSSWSAVVTPAAGAFENGTATGRVTSGALPSDYLPADVTASIRIFTVK